MERIFFNKKNLDELENLALNSKRVIFNFLNLYSIYLFNKNPEFRNALIKIKGISVTSADGFPLAVYLKSPRVRGYDFAEKILSNKSISKTKRHFFLGGDSANKKDIKKICKKFGIPIKNTGFYNPPYIKESVFPKEEIDKIAHKIKMQKPDYLWIGLGNPKQEIMSSQLIDKINVRAIFNVGAALDFLSENKRQSPRFFQKIGIEWLYRLISDFNHSKHKVLKSFAGLIYLKKSAF